ncbi:uracil-DNA glycosylase family protein [Bacteroides sp. OttesenSCG-928-D19]|nr:uracil-DNA glycosylase family protein [Bacteroides sp. OttesenSCG-928-D19]
MKNIQFIPWVGKTYEQGVNGKKIMILGESHYCNHPSEAIATLTIDVIQDLFDPNSEHEGYKNTYTKFERALIGKPLSWKEKESVWNSVIFYNYVQTPISGARQSPTTQEFASSEEAFFEVLNKYQPDCIIAWGKRLYNNLPRRGKQAADLLLPDDKYSETWSYTLENGRVVEILPITHPSAAFSPEYWYKAIQMFLNRL